MSNDANSPTQDSAPDTLQVEVLPISNGEVQEPTKAEEPVPTGYVAVADFMGIANPDDEQKDKMQFIWDHYSKGRDRAETLNAIRDIRHTISPPEVGENYLHKLYSYVRLEAEGRAIEREKQAYK